MPVSEADFSDHAATIERLFQEFHEWNKRGVVDSLGGNTVPTDEVKESYDIDSMIREDVTKLDDPEIYTRLFIAIEDGDIVGCVFLDRRTGRIAEVKRLYVHPSARGAGLGRALMEAAIAAAREDDYSKLLLFTAPFTEAAQSLYEDLGFDYRAPFECEAPDEAYDEVVFMELNLN